MKIWLRKIMVVLVTFLTLGIYIPPYDLNTDLDEGKDELSSKADVEENGSEGINTTIAISEPDTLPQFSRQTERNELIDTLTKKAREQTINKLGPKIMEQVDNEFTENILPAIDEVLYAFLADDEGELPYYGITEHPSGGLSEKIFHVYDVRTNTDVARFHVRRDNRPQEGYWFNFHYHLSKDNFEEHHEIGELYWDKNMPPRWMA